MLLLSVLLTAFCLLQLSAEALEDSVKYLDTYGTYLDCIEEFNERQANIFSNLVETITLCQITANNLKVSYDNDKQKERDELIAASAELRERLDACNNQEADYDFFYCHSEAGNTNMLLITDMHVNATKALVDLEDRYSEAEKQRLHCSLDAQHECLRETMTAHEELAICLKASKAARKNVFKMFLKKYLSRGNKGLKS